MTIEEQLNGLRDIAIAQNDRLERLEKEKEEKPWWASRTILSGAFTVAVSIAQVIGYVMGWPAEAMSVLAGLTGAGGVGAMIFRTIAKGPLK